MQIQLIRSATLRVRYNGRLFIIDPFLAAKGTVRSFAGIAPNPIVELPCTPEEAIAGAEMALISHLHVDHFDDTAVAVLPKDLPILCQPGDEGRIMEKGFTAVTPITHSHTWQGITFTRTPGQHGTGEVGQRMGQVSGFVWQAAGEPTVYWAGDTIWYEAVAEIIRAVQPDVIITHSSGAKFGDSDPIVMDAAQTIAVCTAASQATVIAVHLESLDHGTVSRADLRAAAQLQAIAPERLRIPQDGETITL
ncbi:MAG TPA: MBL fold metallo-hydrolase [Chloroflexota bacterium]|nr:MBL fold metallo-hydrolase [Chloroflexota bacterium]HUM71100.1 MBL fold metallo-hydrolase [Chloroflexota bacterium]